MQSIIIVIDQIKFHIHQHLATHCSDFSCLDLKNTQTKTQRNLFGKYFDSFMYELWAHETPICVWGGFTCTAWFPRCDDLVIFWPHMLLSFTWCCNISLLFWFPFIGAKHLLLMILWPFDFELFPIFPQKVKKNPKQRNKCPLRRLDQLYGKVGGSLWALLEEVFLL